MQLSPFTVGRTLLGYHGLSSSAPRDALCQLCLEINQRLTPPLQLWKSKKTPHFYKPISLRKPPGYHNINNPTTSEQVWVWVCRKKGGFDRRTKTPSHHKTLQAAKEEREPQPLPLWQAYGRGHVSCAVDLVHQSLTIKKHTARLIRSQRGEGAAALIAVRLLL